MNEVEVSTPLYWFWNGPLETEKLQNQLVDIQRHGGNEVVIQGRDGLPESEYLSSWWFHNFGIVANQARDLNMGVWIDVEYNWPAGRAGGRVTQNPDFIAKTCKLDKNGQLVIAQSEFQPAFSTDPYVDVLSADVADAFIASTLEEYYKRFPHFFGKPIKGIYVDEPGARANFLGILNKGSIPYTLNLADTYQNMHRRKFEKDAPLIWSREDTAQVREARLRFDETFGYLYRENFLGRIQSWCHKHGIFMKGHVLVEEDPLQLIITQADPFKALGKYDVPGGDMIGGYHPESQIFALKIPQSVAVTHSKPGVMLELFGGFGNGLTVDEMGKIIDWVVRKGGVTRLVSHAVFYSQEGDRPYDHPPVLNSERYWSAFPGLLDRFREGVKNRPNTNPQDTVFFPTEAIQAYCNPANLQEASYISRATQKKVADLVRNGIDFDLLDSDGVLKRLGDYSRLHLPASRVISLETLSEIVRFGRDGGTVIFLGERPQFATRECDQKEFNNLMNGLAEKGRVEDGDFPNLRRRWNIWNVIEPAVRGWDYKHYHNLSVNSPRHAYKYTERKGQISRMWGKIERRFAR